MLKSTVTRRSALRATVAASMMGSFTILSRPASAAEFTYKFGNNLPPAHPMNVRATDAVARIKEESSGRLDIQIFPDNQLGGDTDMLSQLRSGALECFTLSGLILATLIPVTSIYGLAFSMKDYDTVWAAMDGDLGHYLRQTINKAGLHSMDRMWDNGYRHITSSTKPIASPDDLRGFKIRVPISPLWTSMFKTFGAAPTGINWSETYSALQTKIVDGRENSLIVIDLGKVYEVQKYLSLTSHMWDGFFFLVNKRAWDRLPANLQESASRNLDAAALLQRQDMVKESLTLVEQIRSKGLIVNKPDASAFRDTLRKAGFYSEWREKCGPEAWANLERYTGQLT